MVQRLLFWEFSRREAAGQIEGAEFQRKSPVQRVDVPREHWAKPTCLSINSKVYRTSRHRVFERNRPVAQNRAGELGEEALDVSVPSDDKKDATKSATWVCGTCRFRTSTWCALISIIIHR